MRHSHIQRDKVATYAQFGVTKLLFHKRTSHHHLTVIIAFHHIDILSHCVELNFGLILHHTFNGISRRIQQEAQNSPLNFRFRMIFACGMCTERLAQLLQSVTISFVIRYFEPFAQTVDLSTQFMTVDRCVLGVDDVRQREIDADFKVGIRFL